MSTFKLPVIKYALLLLSLVSLLCFSCKKSGTDSTVAAIHGTWKMIAVRDNSTGVVITKPPSVPLDVVITFVSTGFGGGVFTGRTTMNEIWESGYFLAQNQTISIPCMSMTKVGETPWGNEFVDNITQAQHYDFETVDKLNIKTIKKTLTFKMQ